MKNPIYSVRKRLLGETYATVKLQVLVLDEMPSDGSKDAYKLGLTGQLKPKLVEAIKTDSEFEEYFSRLFSKSDLHKMTYDEIYTEVLVRYWICHLYMSTYNVVRIAMNDYFLDPKNDWFRPCYTSLCIWHEHLYRRSLGIGMPQAPQFFDSMQPAFHSLWIQDVQSGEKDVRRKWEIRWTESFAEPSPYSESYELSQCLNLS